MPEQSHFSRELNKSLRCASVTREPVGDTEIEIVTPLIPVDNTVRVSRGNVFNGSGYVRWDNFCE